MTPSLRRDSTSVEQALGIPEGNADRAQGRGHPAPAEQMRHAWITSVKAWCPRDGGHEIETDDINIYCDFGSPCTEVRCPTHGWQDA